VEDFASGVKPQSPAYADDRSADLATRKMAAIRRWGGERVSVIRPPKWSAHPQTHQCIIAAAAAAPMANMQISWMENSVNRTLTTALVWRSAT
jgi:hypothetical protein